MAEDQQDMYEQISEHWKEINPKIGPNYYVLQSQPLKATITLSLVDGSKYDAHYNNKLLRSIDSLAEAKSWCENQVIEHIQRTISFHDKIRRK